MKKGSKQSKRTVVERLVGDHDLPPELLYGGCFIEMRGRNSVTVRGCRRIIRYTPESVVLKMRKDTLEVKGKRLTCITYLAGAVAVEGIVDSVGFVKRTEGVDEA